MQKGLKFVFGLLGALVLINLFFLDWQLLNKKEAKPVEVNNVPEKPVVADSCGETCEDIIARKVTEAVAKITPPVAVVTQKTTNVSSGVQTKVAFVPLGAEGVISSISFTDIIPSEFYFDLENYPGAKEVRFEAYIMALNPGTKIYARLYDQTNKRGVDLSDIQTSSGTYERQESSGIVIWRGNNKYTIQLRSVNGTQVQLKDAKLKIIF